MDTLATALACHCTTIRLETGAPTCFIDLTDRLERFIEGTEIQVGLMTVQTRHTTTAIVINEHEPQLLTDFGLLLDRAAPRNAGYHHDNLALRHDVPPDEPQNGHAHCRALLLPTAASVNVVRGRMTLGRWQRVFLVELDGPREREVSIFAIGSTV
jgi:secondary thiamine-phosphate synthase enzyme